MNTRNTTTVHMLKKTLRTTTKENIERERTKMRFVGSAELHNELAQIPPAYRRDYNINTSLSSFGDAVQLYIYLRITKLDGFKDKRLMHLLEIYAGDEYRPQSTQDWTYNNEPEREYNFDRRYSNGLRVHVQITAAVRSDSPTCRIITTGKREKVVVEDIKEIVCE